MLPPRAYAAASHCTQTWGLASCPQERPLKCMLLGRGVGVAACTHVSANTKLSGALRCSPNTSCHLPECHTLIAGFRATARPGNPGSQVQGPGTWILLNFDHSLLWQHDAKHAAAHAHIVLKILCDRVRVCVWGGGGGHIAFGAGLLFMQEA
jgi:hypothetical protein